MAALLAAAVARAAMLSIVSDTSRGAMYPLANREPSPPVWSPPLPYCPNHFGSYGIASTLAYCCGSAASGGITNPCTPADVTRLPSIVPNVRVPQPSTNVSPGLLNTSIRPRTRRSAGDKS